MSKSLQIVGPLVLLLLTGGMVRAQEEMTFRYKPAQKEKPLYKTTVSMEQTQSIGDQKIKTTMTQTSVNRWTFEKTDKQGNLQYRTETQQMQVKLKIDPVGEYEFDSKAGELEGGSVLSEALNPIYDRLATAALTVTISPKGEVTAVSGHKELIGELLKDNPFAAQIAGGATDDAAKINIADQFISFGDKPVKPGDSWESEFEVDMQGIGKSKGKRIYTYVGPDKVGETATAKFTGKLELSIDIDINANGSKINGSLSVNDSDGTIQFDPEKGRVVSMNSKYTIGGDYSIMTNNVNQNISSTQTQTVKRMLLEKLPE